MECLMRQSSMTLARIVRGDRKSINVAMEVMRANKFTGVIDLVAAALDEKQKLATLAILWDLAMADGVLAGEEKAVLQLYMDKFGIPEAKLPHRCDCHQERFLNLFLTFFSGLENILLKKTRDAGGPPGGITGGYPRIVPYIRHMGVGGGMSLPVLSARFHHRSRRDPEGQGPLAGLMYTMYPGVCKNRLLVTKVHRSWMR